MGDTVPG